MHHPAVETCPSHRKVVVREFHEEDLRTYASLSGYSRVYVGLKITVGQAQDEKSLIWV